jgi:hypothetical protein
METIMIYHVCMADKLASLNRSWQSNKGTFRASGLPGIELISLSQSDWTPLSPMSCVHATDCWYIACARQTVIHNVLMYHVCMAIGDTECVCTTLSMVVGERSTKASGGTSIWAREKIRMAIIYCIRAILLTSSFEQLEDILTVALTMPQWHRDKGASQINSCCIFLCTKSSETAAA